MAELLGLPRVLFDFGAVKQLGEELGRLGVKRPLVITDQGIAACGVLDKLKRVLPERPKPAIFDRIPENPTIGGVEGAATLYREEACDGIVAVGGGSVLDSGKAVRIAVTHAGPIIDYLKDTSKIGPQAVPYVTVPTTAGTGAEITPGGGIHPTEGGRAYGLRSPHNKPSLAICDPELTFSLPPGLTAATGLDAFGHCLEGFVASKVDPPTDAISLDGMRRVASFIERAVADGNDREARWHMLMAALEGGICIYKGLGPMHALAHTFGDAGLHHGMLVALAAPVVVRAYEPHVGERLGVIAEALNLPSGRDLAPWLEALNLRVGLPANLRAAGYDKTDIEEMAIDAQSSFFNQAAPYHPDVNEYKELVSQVLGQN